ncbi:MAG TPA: cytochrome c [Xanthobacteraceae bacterium]|jgi:mono/diheme cytochrome c family protein
MPHSPLARAALIALAVLVIGAAGFFAVAWRPTIGLVAARATPAPKDVARGAELAAIGNCITCHTRRDGAPYAGGRPIETPFGIVYSTNITPDEATGIGGWSEEAFRRAVRDGVSQDGHHLYPVFPYDHMTKMREEDIRAVYAFIITRAPVHANTPANPLPFPFGFRPLLAYWKLLFLDRGAVPADPSQGDEWNHGAYLVEGLAHCGACHTPRNALGAEERDKAYAGGEAEGWLAPALNAASPAAVPWNAERLFSYLRTGWDDEHGVSAGPMAPVVHNLGSAPESEVRAIAAYVASVAGSPSASREEAARKALARAKGETPAPSEAGGPGAAIYAGACAQCHGEAGRHPLLPALDLTLSSTLRNPRPDNAIRIIRGGIQPVAAAAGPMMPPFAEAMTDAQLVALLAYLRTAFAEREPWNGTEDAVKRARDMEAQQTRAERAAARNTP